MKNSSTVSKVGPIVAGAVGAAVGATAAVILSDKKKRDQISNFIDSAKETMETAREKSEELRDKVEDKAQDAKSKALTKGKEVEKRAKQLSK